MIRNPNEKIASAIEKRLEVTGGHCPCVPQSEWNEDTLCPCLKHRRDNICCCKLYVEE